MSLSFDRKLENYIDVIIRAGLGLQPGQRLLITAPVDVAATARRVVEEAYKAGARLVDVLWTDEQSDLRRFRHAPRDSFEEFSSWRAAALNDAARNGDAVLNLFASDPDVLKNEDAELVALAQKTRQRNLKAYYEGVGANRFSWCIASVPIDPWAKKVFPGVPVREATERLWDAIFTTTRADRDDPVGAWREHIETLERVKRHLNDRAYASLRITGGGTDLTVGLPDAHVWSAANMTTEGGVTYIPNLPTEEVFTLPHADRVDGVVHSSKPLNHAGTLITEFGFRFEGGRVVEHWAAEGERTLSQLLDTDEGARRLGEIALVPHSSPVSRTGLLFYNTLFDENASCHLALGRAYAFSLKGASEMNEEEQRAAGANTSLTHVDFMFGSALTNVDGVTAAGDVESILRDGEWAIDD